MPVPWRRERTPEEVESKAADRALRASCDALYNDHRDAERSVKQAANALRDAERDRTKRIEAAEKQLTTVSSNPVIVSVGGGLFASRAEVRNITVKLLEGEFPLDPSIHARVDARARRTRNVTRASSTC